MGETNQPSIFSTLSINNSKTFIFKVKGMASYREHKDQGKVKYVDEVL